jgi:hypothetical protein
MTRDTFATIRGTAQNLKEMFRIASAGYHDDIYMRVVGSEDTVHFITQTNAKQVMSYCSFSDLKMIDGDGEAVLPVGLDNDTKGILDYLGIAEGTNTVEVTLEGEEGDGDEEHPRLASHWRAKGALTASIRLPGSREDLKKVPWHLPERWTDDDRYLSSRAFDEAGDLAVDEDDIDEFVPPTVIETTTSTVESSIIDPADFMDAVNYYPIIVEDGEFRLNLQGREGDDAIEGEVNAESVTGPDVERHFDDGFAELFGEISGPVTLSTAPDSSEGEPSPPLVVTQTNLSGRKIRHVLGPFAED